MDYLNRHENYVDRRRLFKNIWDTAMIIEDGDAGSDILNKPKAIKTLRLDEVDRCVVPKKKKQRIKNLRTVCNRILKFCDKQESLDCYYEQYATHSNLPITKTDAAPKPDDDTTNHKKVKHVRKRKKNTRAKSVSTPGTYPQTMSSMKSTRNEPPVKQVKRERILRSSYVFKTPEVKTMSSMKITRNEPPVKQVKREKILKNSSIFKTPEVKTMSSMKITRNEPPVKQVKREKILRISSVFKTPQVKAPLKNETTSFGDNVNRSKTVKKKPLKTVK